MSLCSSVPKKNKGVLQFHGNPNFIPEAATKFRLASIFFSTKRLSRGNVDFNHHDNRPEMLASITMITGLSEKYRRTVSRRPDPIKPGGTGGAVTYAQRNLLTPERSKRAMFACPTCYGCCTLIVHSFFSLIALVLQGKKEGLQCKILPSLRRLISIRIWIYQVFMN